ncbi:hypothetical protein Nocox_35650 [Nonomuraea coxensis DSM 45129]|uniref:Uncharacterized protein n=1 Tax=Nonomuraea coxensis DSM 45129 TaxID=1122611 RepID=A0ABX8UAB8_9ACTN|nr:hypothetical protein [Nonomuraea coxensis]QYC44689.1 hypothetical protein Nocox_35650 [Nonomuraea coxensis DSM 45129]
MIAVRRDVIPGQIADLLDHVANALIERGWRPGPETTTRILHNIRAACRRPHYRTSQGRRRRRRNPDTW